MEVLEGFVSVRDAATRAAPENFYQGLLVALCACSGGLTRNFRSQPESGVPDQFF